MLTNQLTRYALTLGLMGIAALSSNPATAQTTVAIPVTGGSFATNATPGADSSFTVNGLISPAGTLNVTGFTGRFTSAAGSATGVINNTDTAVTVKGLATGTAGLNDGRSAAFSGATTYLQGTAKTGSGTFDLSAASGSAVPVTGTITRGSVNVPTTSFSNYTTPQVLIPVTGGQFTGEVTTTGETKITISSALTPLGTLNITGFKNPNFSDATSISSNTTVSLTGLVDGNASFTDGGSANFSNILTTFATKTSVDGGGTYVIGNVPASALKLTGTLTSGNISVPLSSTSGTSSNESLGKILTIIINDDAFLSLSQGDRNKLIRILSKLGDDSSGFLSLSQGDRNQLLKIFNRLAANNELTIIGNRVFINALIFNVSDVLSGDNTVLFVSKKGILTLTQFDLSSVTNETAFVLVPFKGGKGGDDDNDDKGGKKFVVVPVSTQGPVSALSYSRIHPGLGRR